MTITNRKILIIEDDASLQAIYKEMLTDEGFEVVGTTTGQAGLDLAKREKPNLIILDIMLPFGKMNGFDVLETLKRDAQMKTIPILVLTNLDSEEKTAREIGVADYLVKANNPIGKVIEKVKKYFPDSW